MAYLDKYGNLKADGPNGGFIGTMRQPGESDSSYIARGETLYQATNTRNSPSSNSSPAPNNSSEASYLASRFQLYLNIKEIQVLKSNPTQSVDI